MCEELFAGADVDPSTLEDEGLLYDIASQIQRTELRLAAPSGDGGCSFHPGSAGLGGRCTPARTTSPYTCSADGKLHTVESPPGPGPGAGPESGDPEGTWLCGQGSAPAKFWGQYVPHGSPRAGSRVGDGGRGSGATSSNRSGKANAYCILMRFGSGAGNGAAYDFCASGDGGGSPDTPASSRSSSLGLPTRRTPSGRQPPPSPPQQQQQLEGALAGTGVTEDFPRLSAVAAPAAQWSVLGGGAAGQSSGVPARKGRKNGLGGPHRGGGVKVLHAAQPAACGSLDRGELLPPNAPAAHGREGSARDGANGATARAAADDGDSTGFNLTLLWELLQGGLCLRNDPLAAEGGDLEALEPGAAEAIKRLIRTRYPQEDGPARGVSPEDMITMMSRAHRRQCRKTHMEAAAAAAPATAAPPEGATDAVGGGGGSDGGDVSSDDESHLYLGRDESKSWRRTVEWMKENDWVQVKDTDGKHYKYRRWLPNGQIQTQTVCCSPSDAMRGIRNLQADLARKDAQANAAIRVWRREQRERWRRERAAANEA